MTKLIPMGFTCDSHRNSMGLLTGPNPIRLIVDLHVDSTGIPLGVLLDFSWMRVGMQRESNRHPVGLQCDSNGIPMCFQLSSIGMPLGFKKG